MVAAVCQSGENAGSHKMYGKSVWRSEKPISGEEIYFRKTDSSHTNA